MKKTFTVNLGNRVFHMDDDAYMHLREYLDTIESYFSDEKEREDIIHDIEMRLAELFAERLGPSRQVVTLADVKEAIVIMGDPGEIGGVKDKRADDRTYARYTRRRLYRDPDNMVFGGVCGGLGAYLDIDPVILRVILVILFFAFGVGLLVYLILWIVVPMARTTAQKLEMRGDPVNVSNIGSFFREEFDSVKKSFKRKR